MAIQRASRPKRPPLNLCAISLIEPAPAALNASPYSTPPAFVYAVWARHSFSKLVGGVVYLEGIS